MTHMFDNYPQPTDYIPSNRKLRILTRDTTIMAGESTVHSFDIPFDVESDTLDYQVIYKLGLTIVIVKDKDALELSPYDEEHHETTLTCRLNSQETLVFSHTLLSAHVQIRFVMADGSIAYTDIYPIKLSDALMTTEPVPPTPGPGIIGGIGYTED